MVRHIFLTGQPGIGKSTLCQRVLQHTFEGLEPCGFCTAEVRDTHGERAGFDVITLSGQRGPLARAGASGGRANGPAVGKYTVDVKSFERLALPALRVSPATRLLLIDEIGKMELFSRPFFPAVRAALDCPHVVVLGTIPTPRQGHVLPEVAEVAGRADVQVITVTHANRDALVSELQTKLRELMRALPAPPLPSQQQQCEGQGQAQGQSGAPTVVTAAPPLQPSQPLNERQQRRQQGGGA